MSVIEMLEADHVRIRSLFSDIGVLMSRRNYRIISTNSTTFSPYMLGPKSWSSTRSHAIAKDYCGID